LRAPWVPWAVLGVGLVLALAGARSAHLATETDARREFVRTAAIPIQGLEGRLQAYGDVLHAIRGLFSASEKVTREDFRHFVQGLQAEQRYPGIAAISYAVRVGGDERNAFERAVRSESSPFATGFAIRPEGERPEYLVLDFVEPLVPNIAVWGLDVMADPDRRDAVLSARDSGKLSASIGVSFLPDAGAREAGLLLRLPIYRGRLVPSSLEARQEAFIGVAGAAVRVSQLMGSILGRHDWVNRRFTLQAENGAVLFDSHPRGRSNQAIGLHAYAHFAVSQQVRFGDRALRINVIPLADPLSRAHYLLAAAAGAAILGAAILFAALIRSLATSEARAIALEGAAAEAERGARRLEEAQEVAGLGSWEWMLGAEHMVWSDELYRLFGREPGDPAKPTFEFLEREVLRPEDIAGVRAALRHTQAEGRINEFEFRIRHPDGAVRILASRASRDTDAGGTVVRMKGTLRDVTEKRQAEEREREQLAFVQTVIDAIPSPVCYQDTSGYYLGCNDAFCRYAGRRRDEILGRTAYDLLPAEQADLFERKNADMLRDGGAQTFEARLTVNGRDYDVLMHRAAYPRPDGSIGGIVGVVTDITERKMAQAQLASMVEELTRKNEEARAIAALGEALQSCLSVEEALEALSKTLPETLPGTRGVLYMMDATGMRVQRAAAWGSQAQVHDVFTANDCLALRRGQARCVTDTARELNCRHFTGTLPGSYGCIPLFAHGDILGLLHLQPEEGPGATHCDRVQLLQLVTTITEHVALALANLGLRERLREQATRDALTGLYNRNYMHEWLDLELHRSRRNGQSIAAILIDVDHFKRFNDTFGHDAGDQVLREVGALLKGLARRSDVACRIGGEELVVLLPNATSQAARRRAEELRAAIATLRLEHAGRPLGAITVSAGVASFPDSASDLTTLLKAADEALYEAKRGGRDRVVVAVARGSAAHQESARDRVAR
ncbi:MAG: diguanylate cyclase, partial [Burkholderiales bacterium]